MKKSLLLMGCFAAALVHAHPVTADVSVGVAASAAHGAKNSGQELPVGHLDAAPSIGVGLSSPIAGSLGCGLRVNGVIGSASTIEAADVTASQQYAVSASAGLTYQSGASVFYAGPALQYSNFKFAGEGVPESKMFDGFGVAASVSHQVTDMFGVRVNLQHVLNKSINNWSESSLDQSIGQLTSSMSQISMSVYADIDPNLLSKI